jgi:ribosomal protein L14
VKLCTQRIRNGGVTEVLNSGESGSLFVVVGDVVVAKVHQFHGLDLAESGEVSIQIVISEASKRQQRISGIGPSDRGNILTYSSLYNSKLR